MRFYTGCYTRLGGGGVGVCRYENGALTQLAVYHDVDEPTYVILSRDGRTLFTAGNLPGTDRGYAASYRIHGDSLRLLSLQDAAAQACCHMAESADARFLYVAGYLTGTVSVFPLDDGVLGERIQRVQHEGSGPVTDRQEAAHAHQCMFRPGHDNELFVCDLGADAVFVHHQDAQTGLLTLQERISVPAGMGPRHLVFADENCFYVTGELDNFVRRYECLGGVWTLTGACSALPEGYAGESYTAAIRLHEGDLYVSNRGHDSICRIAVGASGALRPVGWTATEGLFPRDFVFVPGGMLVANQNGGGVTMPGTALRMTSDGVVCICPDPTTV